MSTFLNGLMDKLTALEQEMQILPGELDSIVMCFDKGKWESLVGRLNQDFDKQLDELVSPKRNGALVLPQIMTLQPFEIRSITDEDLSRWRAVKKPEIRVLIGGRRVEVTAASKLSGKTEIEVSQEQGYIVLSWDHYQKLLDEIGKLISTDD
jgi:hypothetical protein